MNLGLGIDTGGTFTDAAIIDLDTTKVLAKAKSPTTYEDLPSVSSGHWIGSSIIPA